MPAGEPHTVAAPSASMMTKLVPACPQTQRGFTYIGLLWWVAISGVMLAALGQQWRMEGRRERETEMVFRARQIQAAIRSYQAVANGPAAQNLPEKLEDLLEDRRGPRLKRHLRQLWRDPVSDKPWGEIRVEGRIRGVYSESEKAPIAAPEGVQRYSEWLFDVEEQHGDDPTRTDRGLAVPKLEDLTPSPAWPMPSPVKSVPRATEGKPVF